MSTFIQSVLGLCSDCCSGPGVPRFEVATSCASRTTPSARLEGFQGYITGGCPRFRTVVRSNVTTSRTETPTDYSSTGCAGLGDCGAGGDFSQYDASASDSYSFTDTPPGSTALGLATLVNCAGDVYRDQPVNLTVAASTVVSETVRQDVIETENFCEDTPGGNTSYSYLHSVITTTLTDEDTFEDARARQTEGVTVGSSCCASTGVLTDACEEAETTTATVTIRIEGAPSVTAFLVLYFETDPGDVESTLGYEFTTDEEGVFEIEVPVPQPARGSTTCYRRFEITEVP